MGALVEIDVMKGVDGRAEIRTFSQLSHQSSWRKKKKQRRDFVYFRSIYVTSATCPIRPLHNAINLKKKGE